MRVVFKLKKCVLFFLQTTTVQLYLLKRSIVLSKRLLISNEENEGPEKRRNN